MKLNKKGEAGLWFVAAAMHYNVANFRDCSLNKFQAMVRSKRSSNRKNLGKNLERHFGNLLNIFFCNDLFYLESILGSFSI
jgi:hypothetical protein